MGLAVAVFVPEGIVIVSDGLAEIRNEKSDNAFLQTKQKCLFSFENTFLLCVQGSGYIKGLPYAYYLNGILKAMEGMVFKSTEAFCFEFKCRVNSIFPKEERVVFYIAGVDSIDDATPVPVIYLLDNNLQIINQSNNNDVVYNYHSYGRNLWINKLLLPTTFKYGKNEYIEFDNCHIDFSKYSIEDAIEFGKTILEISYKMDKFTQLKQMVGENVTVGYITLNGELRIENMY
jgi:hypothetical protein